MRRVLILTLLTSLLILIAPAQADDPPATWTAWLHYGRHLTLIDSNGDTLREIDLPLPEGYGLVKYQSQKAGISRNGEFIAYLVSGEDFSVQLILFDLVHDVIVLTYTIPELGSTSLYNSNQQMFNESNTAFAFGYRTIGNSWQLLIFDIVAKQVAFKLKDTDPVAAILNLNQLPWNTRIWQFENMEVSFTLGFLDSDKDYAFVWNLVSNKIQPGFRFAFRRLDFFPPTGEVLSIDYSSYPTSYYFQVYDPTLSARYPFAFVTNSNFPPVQIKFIQNGERILAGQSIMERDGTIVGDWKLPNNIALLDFSNTSMGFVYTALVRNLEDGNPTILPALYEVDTRDDKLDVGRVVWQISMKEFQSYFEPSEQPFFDIAWVHSDAPVGPFKPWAQLAEPVYAPTPQPSDMMITPTLIPTPPPLFHAGQTVRVQTIDGEILNLRAAPTRKSEIVVYIEDDTQLELLEGPVEAEGFYWWRVRLPDGLEGWVVENDGELQTLMPQSS